MDQTHYNKIFSLSRLRGGGRERLRTGHEHQDRQTGQRKRKMGMRHVRERVAERDYGATATEYTGAATATGYTGATGGDGGTTGGYGGDTGGYGGATGKGQNAAGGIITWDQWEKKKKEDSGREVYVRGAEAGREQQPSNLRVVQPSKKSKGNVTIPIQPQKVCVCVCVYMYICMCVYIYIYIDLYIYIYIYIYTHTQMYTQFDMHTLHIHTYICCSCIE